MRLLHPEAVHIIGEVVSVAMCPRFPIGSPLSLGNLHVPLLESVWHIALVPRAFRRNTPVVPPCTLPYAQCRTASGLRYLLTHLWGNES